MNWKVLVLFGASEYFISENIHGYWFDRCTLNNPKEKTGFGLKIDIAFGRMIRPIPVFWKKGFWTGKPTIQEVMDKGDIETDYPVE